MKGMKDGDVVGVVVEKAFLGVSVLGTDVVSLEFSTLNLCFHSEGLMSRLFSRTSNEPVGSPSLYRAAERRADLRQALGGFGSPDVFTEEELSGMVGKRLCIVIQEVEFRGRMLRRVTDFLPHHIEKGKTAYSDEEYVYMIKELGLDDGT